MSESAHQQEKDLPSQGQAHQPGRQSGMQPPPQGEAKVYVGADKLRGKKAIITGGDSGIGRAVAVAFAKEGADVAIVYLEEKEDAAETERLVKEAGAQFLGIRGDLSDHAFCAKVAEKVAYAFGRIDVLVNNAGEQHTAEDFTEISPEQLERTFRSNIFSMFFLTQAVLPKMPKGSAIVNTTSVTAYRGSSHLIDYSATKGAIVAFTRSLAQSLAEKEIRVNAVAPGPIWTPLIPASFQPEEVEKFGKKTPLGRHGEPDEVAPSYVFLASADASYMTGQVLHPNGGEPVGS